MSYCVNCGTELGRSEQCCPLCGTEVIHPACPPDPSLSPFPRGEKPSPKSFSKRASAVLMTLIYLLPVSICLLCDLNICGRISWSGYVLFGGLFVYVCSVFPLWLRRPHPILPLALDFAALLGYLYYIESYTGGKWFLPFALPVTVAAAAFVLLITGIALHTPITPLGVIALSLFCSGVFCVITELLIGKAFFGMLRLNWSLYPLIACSIIALILVQIGKNAPMREKLEKKLFI